MAHTHITELPRISIEEIKDEEVIALWRNGPTLANMKIVERKTDEKGEQYLICEIREKNEPR